MWQAICIAGIVSLFFHGCDSFRRDPRSTSPVDSAQQTAPAAQPPRPLWRGTRFDDVPVPPALTLDYDASYINVAGQRGGARVADLRYTGRTAVTETLASMQQGMLRSGWTSTSLTGVAIKSLRFTKDDEECQLIIRKGEEGETVLVVRLHPRP